MENENGLNITEYLKENCKELKKDFNEFCSNFDIEPNQDNWRDYISNAFELTI